MPGTTEEAKKEAKEKLKEELEKELKNVNPDKYDPDKYDGSYELMRKTIEAYQSSGDIVLDYHDLNTIYLMTVGTWRHSIERKKESIKSSHLPKEKQDKLIGELERIYADVTNGKYEHSEDPKNQGKRHMGMFGTGFYSFEGKATDESARAFISMCVDIAGMTDEKDIFKQVDEVLQEKSFRGMRAASASMILHCLKPTVFPILNGYSGKQGVYKALGLRLNKPTEISTYIKNCELIRDYRNKEFIFKNYRVFDELNIPQSETDAQDQSSAETEETEDKETRKLLDFQKNIILYGPPGTGKTYYTAYYAVAIIDGISFEDIKNEDPSNVKERYDRHKEAGRIAFTTFHQSYGYEEFVEGIKPILGNSRKATLKLEYAIEPGVFKKFCDKARVSPSERYVFIIDEINRGNISKIFGEMITLIEDSKRIGNGKGMKLTLPYSKKPFGVPDNVYIIGTMNTADRSIALMDTALRRRFHFVEMMPDPSAIGNDVVVGNDAVVNGINIGEMLEVMNERIEYLYDREHLIGHSYFMPLTEDGNNTLKLLASIFRNQIIPLLQEYFFEDYEKIRLVLGDNQKAEPLQFLKKKKVSIEGLFGKDEDIDPDKVIYEIQKSAFDELEAYTGIYK